MVKQGWPEQRFALTAYCFLVATPVLIGYYAGDCKNSVYERGLIDRFTGEGISAEMAYYKSEGTPAEFWPGAVDDVRLYTGALTADRIETLYSSYLDREIPPYPEVCATA